MRWHTEAISIAWPEARPPVMTSTLSWEMSFSAIVAASAFFAMWSSRTTSIFLPFTPPAALISSTAIAYAFLNLSPNGASGPVMGRGAPIFRVWASAGGATAATASRTASMSLRILSSSGEAVRVMAPGRAERRHGEVRPGRRGGLGPAGRDGLGAGVELHSLRAVDVQIAEERLLPAAKREEGHGHRDGDVHPHHPHLHLVLEALRRRAGAGEDGGAVAVGVRVDDREGLLERAGAEHDQHWPEDLLAVDRHRRA